MSYVLLFVRRSYIFNVWCNGNRSDAVELDENDKIKS